MGDMRVGELVEEIFQMKNHTVFEGLIAKLAKHNIHVGSDLLGISTEALDMKLYIKGDLTLEESTYTLDIRDWVEKRVVRDLKKKRNTN